MAKWITLCLFMVGLINFVPVAGILGAQKLENAYDIVLSSNDLVILMRHRALLFGLVGGFVLYSVFVPVYQKPAMVMAGISMVGFAVIVFFEGGYNGAISKVLIADFVGIGFLCIAGILHFVSKQ